MADQTDIPDQCNPHQLNWCEYFTHLGSEVGISLDGPRDIHDFQRPRRHGKGSFDQVMTGIAALREHHIRVNALCVLTPLSLSQPERVFDFFLSQQIFDVAFNIEEVEGIHDTSLLSIRMSRSNLLQEYSAFMESFWTATSAMIHH